MYGRSPFRYLSRPDLGWDDERPFGPVTRPRPTRRRVAVSAPEVPKPEAVEEPEAKPDEPDHAERQELTALREELERVRASEAQLTRDFKNFRRHAEADLAAVAARARVALLAELADTVGALEAAGNAAEEDPTAVREGVVLVARSLQKIFDANNLQRIASEGVTFDPTVHEAVLVEKVDGVEKGTIVREMSPGFRTDDEVIRPAKVSVAS